MLPPMYTTIRRRPRTTVAGTELPATKLFSSSFLLLMLSVNLQARDWDRNKRFEASNWWIWHMVLDDQTGANGIPKTRSSSPTSGLTDRQIQYSGLRALYEGLRRHSENWSESESGVRWLRCLASALEADLVIQNPPNCVQWPQLPDTSKACVSISGVSTTRDATHEFFSGSVEAQTRICQGSVIHRQKFVPYHTSLEQN
jgi:hypothetical protein